jgi:hypothetical protein
MITSCRTHGKPSRDSDATMDSAVPCLSLSSQLQVLGLKEPLVAMSKIHSNSLHRLERGRRRACYHDHNFDRTIDREIQLKLWIANHSSPAHFLMH